MVKIQKKGVLITMLVVLILVVSGCNTNRTEEPNEVNYRTGTVGLELTFPTDTPTEVYENDRDVRFVIEVRNKGAFPQTEETDEFRGKLWIGGYDDKILKIYPRLGSSISQGVNLRGDELEGRSPYNRDGGYSAVEFQMDVGDLPQGMPYYNPNIIVTASYLYKTIANPIICIDPEPRSTRIREKVCDITDSISVGSQGAPIAVTKVEEDVTGNDFLFKIYIENTNKGLVIPESQVDNNPNEGYDWRDMDKVRIEDIRAGNVRMTECRPTIGRDVQLIEDKGYIFCRLDKTIAQDKAYETSLNIVLSYGYTTSEEKEIEVFEEVSFR